MLAPRETRAPALMFNVGMQVLLKTEYEQKRSAQAGSSAQHSLSQPGHKRAKHHEHAGTPVSVADANAGLVEELRKEKEEVLRLQKRLAEVPRGRQGPAAGVGGWGGAACMARRLLQL